MANNIYVGQDYQLTLDTNVDLTTASTKQIRYKKPSETSYSSVDATVSGTTLIAQITDTINNEAGDWLFHAYVITSNSKIYIGDIVSNRVRSLTEVPV